MNYTTMSLSEFDRYLNILPDDMHNLVDKMGVMDIKYEEYRNKIKKIQLHIKEENVLLAIGAKPNQDDPFSIVLRDVGVAITLKDEIKSRYLEDIELLLSFFVIFNFSDAMKYLVTEWKLNIDITVVQHNVSLFMFAAQRGRVEIMKFLLQQNPNVIHKVTENGTNALMMAVDEGHYDAVKYLVDNGIDPHKHDNAGNTPLMIAGIRENKKIASYLIANMKDFSQKSSAGLTALTTIIAFRELHLVQHIVETNIDLDVPTATKWKTAMIISIIEKDEEIFHYLLSRGANIHITNIDGKTTLMFAASSGMVKVAKSLIDAGIGIDVQDSTGSTALMVATWSHHFYVAKLLITSNANKDLQNNLGFTALMIAIRDNDTPIAKELINSGANMYLLSIEENIDALGLATYLGNLEVLKCIFEHGVDINRQLNGETPIITAVKEKHHHIVKFLLDHGAKTNIKNITDECALDIALANRDKEMVHLLSTHTMENTSVLGDMTDDGV